MRAIILTAILLFAPLCLHATEPCMHMTEKQFTDDVLKNSSVVVYATVEDYSADAPGLLPKKWTKVKVLQTLKPEGPLDGQTLTIKDWQAKDYPLFAYDKGAYLLLFLKEQKGDFVLTNDAWKWCVPAVWNAKADKTAYRDFSVDEKDDGAWLPLDAIRDSINKQN
jgi:hypothetical protein